MLGQAARLSLPSIAIVGSRKPTLRTLSECFHLGRQLALAGINVVSGGAFGCDIKAHEGVLSANPQCATVIMAGGLGCLYPKSHYSRFLSIVSGGGALVSERIWDYQPRPFDFPIRNRIIAGLCREVIIMEAKPRSGSLTTAQVAIDNGREVYVLTPAADTPMEIAGGSMSLIQDGAYCFRSADYLMKHLKGD